MRAPGRSLVQDPAPILVTPPYEAIGIDPAPVYLGLRFDLWIYGVAVILGII